MEVAEETKNISTYDPVIPLLGIHPEETMVQKDTRALMFTVALFK